MKAQLDMNRIARGLGAERRGTVSARSGYFGAMGLLAEIEARFRTPRGGGRPTDPRWTERRLVPLTPRTLERLEKLSGKIRKQVEVDIEPMQLAALLLERSTEGLTRGKLEKLLVRTGGRRGRATAR